MATRDIPIVEKLTDHIGARVSGIDLRQNIDPRTVEVLRKAWLENIVLVFPDQNLSQEDLLRVSSAFGTVGKLSRPAEFQPPGFDRLLPNIMLISNIRENGQTIGALPDGEMMFHHDMIHSPRPHDGTFLYAIEIPSFGGNTLFASGYAAYEQLNPALRERLEGRSARHKYHYGSTQKGDDRGITAFAESTHPVFRTHDETGRKAVYVNRLMTTSIDGIDEDEGEAILERLWTHSERSDFVYEHVWTKGDLLLWDNRCSSHARTDFPADQRRLMLRTTIEPRQAPS